MKKIVALSAALLLTAQGFAQTEVLAGTMRGKDYGVTYMLPTTELEIVLHTTRHSYTPGEFCKYAERYLHLTDAQPEASTHWNIDKLTIRPVGVPDKEKIYFVKLKDKTVAPLMELTEDGIVRSINMPFSGQGKREEAAPAGTASTLPTDPRSFLTEEILMANSSAKRAELVAKEIYNIRESRNALLRGEADNMPQDGEQLKLMLDNLNLQEQAMLSMFAGTTVVESKVHTVRIPVHVTAGEVAFRFSRHFGLVGADNLAGEPYYIVIDNLTPDLQAPSEGEVEKKKSLDGVAYNVPGRARVQVKFEGRTLYDQEISVAQFGTQEYLAPVLFNKTSVIKVLFDVTTGRLIKVDRGEP